ncbi:hypothetical protein [Microbacterium lacticum]|uniref:hypothetical protein n=1 Tax=Microbacterium lacticum TaxID=33885 RepID=UPI001476C2F6|nr:hypothetical protein [Microbacterium lacticum]
MGGVEQNARIPGRGGIGVPGHERDGDVLAREEADAGDPDLHWCHDVRGRLFCMLWFRCRLSSFGLGRASDDRGNDVREGGAVRLVHRDSDRNGPVVTGGVDDLHEVSAPPGSGNWRRSQRCVVDGDGDGAVVTHVEHDLHHGHGRMISRRFLHATRYA